MTLSDSMLEFINGDIKKLSMIAAVSHDELFMIAQEAPELVVTRKVLIKVITEWMHGKTCDDDVQKWASFVKRGYLPRQHLGSIKPISISYANDDEEMISEVVGRLDELGDKVDGKINVDEKKAMLLVLQRCGKEKGD